MATRTAEIIVIGGGVIGASIAYHLASAKMDVMLLEQHGPAAGSSGACDGAVLLQSKKPGIHLRMAMASIKRFTAFNEELPYPIEYKNHGGMVIIENEAELAAMREFVDRQTCHGLDVSLLDGDQAREIVPGLSKHIIGATYSPQDGKVNPIRLTLALILGARDKGARVRWGEAVQGIDCRNRKVCGVTTSKDRYNCRVVVNATGALAPSVGRLTGLKIPIKPRRGQIVITQAVESLARCCLLTAGYIAAKFDPAAAVASGQGVSIDQTAKGNILLGSTREFVGYNRQTTFAGMAQIARRARHIIPRLGELNVIRSFAGLRPYTPDGLPILGPVESIEGLIMAAGHEGDGIALSPITGALITQLIVGETPEMPLDPFNINRFAIAN